MYLGIYSPNAKNKGATVSPNQFGTLEECLEWLKAEKQKRGENGFHEPQVFDVNKYVYLPQEQVELD